MNTRYLRVYNTSPELPEYAPSSKHWSIQRRVRVWNHACWRGVGSTASIAGAFRSVTASISSNLKSAPNLYRFTSNGPRGRKPLRPLIRSSSAFFGSGLSIAPVSTLVPRAYPAVPMRREGEAAVASHLSPFVRAPAIHAYYLHLL